MPFTVLANLPQLSGDVPQGYLRLLVFNRDSALVSQQVQQLTQAALGGYEPLRLQAVLPQDGYVTAYVGTESDVDVFFDDVSVEHRPGLHVQETHYDAAGLELAGLAPPSPGLRGLNNYRFNGKELQLDLGLNWNHQDWRFLDPTTLHWNGLDPELENGQESWSPYSFGFDNAVRYADANGRCPTCPDVGQAAQNAINQELANINQVIRNAGNKMVSVFNNAVDNTKQAVQKGVDTVEQFGNSIKGKGDEQRVGLVLEASSPNGTDPGGNTAKKQLKGDGDHLQTLLDAAGAVINRKGTTYREAVDANQGRELSDVTSAAGDAVDARREAQARQVSPQVASQKDKLLRSDTSATGTSVSGQDGKQYRVIYQQKLRNGSDTINDTKLLPVR